MGAEIRAQSAREAAEKAAREADRAEAEAHGRCGWRAMAGLPSRLLRSVNASMAVWAGLRWSTIAARCGRAGRSMPLSSCGS